MDEQVGEQTAWWERHYDQQSHIGDYFRKRMGIALAWAGEERVPRQGALMLDAGCGGGQLAVQAGAAGCRVIGMDHSHEMLKKSAQLTRNRLSRPGTFFQADIENIPLMDNCLDILVCLGVVSYLRSERKALAEFARMLKPGGLLIISGTNKARLIKRLDIPMMIQSLRKKSARTSLATNGAGVDSSEDAPQRSYWIPGFTRALAENGFQLSGLETLPYDLPTIFGREFLPRPLALRIAGWVEDRKPLPLVGSMGSMWMIKARKERQP